VLLVSRLERDRHRYAVAFRQRGYCTLQAANTADACRLAAEMLPAAVIADVDLSICEDGVPLVRRLREESGLWHIPVVILAGTRTPVAAAIAPAGIDLFVIPPGDAQRLVGTVALLMRPQVH